jgi:hypothetical protein
VSRGAHATGPGPSPGQCVTTASSRPFSPSSGQGGRGLRWPRSRTDVKQATGPLCGGRCVWGGASTPLGISTTPSPGAQTGAQRPVGSDGWRPLPSAFRAKPQRDPFRRQVVALHYDDDQRLGNVTWAAVYSPAIPISILDSEFISVWCSQLPAVAMRAT